MTWGKEAAYNEIKFTTPVVLDKKKWVDESDFPEMLKELNRVKIHHVSPRIFKLYSEMTDGTTTVCLTQDVLCLELKCSQSVVYDAMRALREKKVLVLYKKTPLGFHYYINKRDKWNLDKKSNTRHQRRYLKQKGKSFSFTADEALTQDILELARIKEISVNQLLRGIVYPCVEQELKKCRTLT